MTNCTDLPVVNHTKLSGLFAVSTEGWLRMRLPPPPPGATGNVNFSVLPSIFTVLGKLGLELDQQDASLSVYAVEHIEPHPPIDNAIRRRIGNDGARTSCSLQNGIWELSVLHPASEAREFDKPRIQDARFAIVAMARGCSFRYNPARAKMTPR